MSFKLKSWNDVGILGIVFIVATLIVSALLSQLLANSLLPLGSSQLCKRYSGLPDNWASDKMAGMVYLSSGEFILGTTLGYEEERQEIKTHVKGFWIDQTEVSVAQFAAFVKATGYVTEAEREGGGLVFRQPTSPDLSQRPYTWWNYVKRANWKYPEGSGSKARDNEPVTQVTLSDAKAYAGWIGHDLPTEAEWEYAAKASRHGANLEQEPRDSAGKPLANFWQGEFPTRNTLEDGYQGLAPVGCFPANNNKLYDMVGNTWEQTQDVYRESHQAQFIQYVSANNPKPNQLMVIKGGSHLCGRDFCVRYRPSAREAHEANLPTSHIGFRTVLRDKEVNSLPNFEAW